MNKTRTHIVLGLSSPMRLQEYGVGIFDEIGTKSALKKILKKQCIQVNDIVATSATFIHEGDRISLEIPNDVKFKRKLIFPLKVLFEDDYLAVIHKPAGILISGNSFKTITNALVQNLEESKLSDATTPQPVHRLDYATTGLLLIGKTSSSIRRLNKLFENKEVAKTYYAVTIGEIDTKGIINSEIDGKKACSIFSLQKTVPSNRFGKLNLVKLEPKTGRRHQLRKHLSGIGTPILGDKDYGIEDLILNGKGMYLHALSLKFTHPFTMEAMHVIDDFPYRFKKIFNHL